MLTFTHHLLFDHFQFALIHGPNIPGSYAILLFTASDLASLTSYIHNWVLEQPHVQGAVAAWMQEGLEEPSHIEGQEGRR